MTKTLTQAIFDGIDALEKTGLDKDFKRRLMVHKYSIMLCIRRPVLDYIEQCLYEYLSKSGSKEINLVELWQMMSRNQEGV